MDWSVSELSIQLYWCGLTTIPLSLKYYGFRMHHLVLSVTDAILLCCIGGLCTVVVWGQPSQPNDRVTGFNVQVCIPGVWYSTETFLDNNFYRVWDNNFYRVRHSDSEVEWRVAAQGQGCLHVSYSHINKKRYSKQHVTYGWIRYLIK